MRTRRGSRRRRQRQRLQKRRRQHVTLRQRLQRRRWRARSSMEIDDDNNLSDGGSSVAARATTAWKMTFCNLDASIAATTTTSGGSSSDWGPTLDFEKFGFGAKGLDCVARPSLVERLGKLTSVDDCLGEYASSGHRIAVASSSIPPFRIAPGGRGEVRSPTRGGTGAGFDRRSGGR